MGEGAGTEARTGAAPAIAPGPNTPAFVFDFQACLICICHVSMARQTSRDIVAYLQLVGVSPDL